MKTLISLITLFSLTLSAAAYAAGYSGNAQTRGMVSKTGFVKERTNEEDHMDGKTETKPDADDSDDKPDEGSGYKGAKEK